MPFLKFSRTGYQITGLRSELETSGFTVLNIKPAGEYIWVEVAECAPSGSAACIYAEHVTGEGEPSDPSGPHTHPITDITNLSSTLSGKCASNDPRLSDARTPLAHSHAQSEVAGLVAALAGAVIPAGIICMWSGLLANIPSGWVLCDGQNGSPDLRSRFIKGSAGDPGATGGSLTHTHANHSNLAHSAIAVADHPSHTHTYTQVPNHVHVQRMQGGTTGATTGTHVMGSTATGGSLRNSAQSTLDPTGGVATATTNGPNATLSHTVTQPNDHSISAHDAVNHEPPYFALAFIMKL